MEIEELLENLAKKYLPQTFKDEPMELDEPQIDNQINIISNSQNILITITVQKKKEKEELINEIKQNLQKTK